MCWKCDNPGKTEDDYITMLRQLIAEHGWAVQGVEPGSLHPGWAYTVGLTEKGLPELVMTGISPQEGAKRLNAAAERIAAGDDLPDSPAVEVVTVARPWAHLLYAVALYGEEIRAWQLVYQDKAGNWPWNAGYSMPSGPQPVLGVRTGA